MDGLKELGCHLVQVDITDLESVKKARDYVAKETSGKLDILLNNA